LHRKDLKEGLYSYIFLWFYRFISIYHRYRPRLPKHFQLPVTGSFINPAGVTSLKFGLWGGGGGGGGSITNNAGGGGGGGGGFL
jgi:hypothetical protein